MAAFGLGNANSRDHGGDENVKIADYYTHIELIQGADWRRFRQADYGKGRLMLYSIRKDKLKQAGFLPLYFLAMILGVHVWTFI